MGARTCIAQTCQKAFPREEGRGQLGITRTIDPSRIDQCIRAKVERERLTDREIARLRHVGPTTGNSWRQQFHRRPADTCTSRFQEKYGAEALMSFDMMRRNRATLQEITRSFGVSRAYARQGDNKRYHGSSRAPQLKQQCTEPSRRQPGCGATTPGSTPRGLPSSPPDIRTPADWPVDGCAGAS